MNVVRSSAVLGLSSPTRIIALCSFCILGVAAIVVIEPADSRDMEAENQRLRGRISELIANSDLYSGNDVAELSKRAVVAENLVDEFQTIKLSVVHLNATLRLLANENGVELQHIQIADSPTAVIGSTQQEVGQREVVMRGVATTISISRLLNDLGQLGFRHVVHTFELSGLANESVAQPFTLTIRMFEACVQSKGSGSMERQP